MTIETNEIAPKTEATADKAHRIARATLGALPMFSGTALEVFNSVVEPPLEKRKLEWMLQVTKVINELERKFDIEIETLADNEKFISSLLHASQIAIKNHQNEKIEALKAALLNSARNTGFSDDQEFLFLNTIDQFSVAHINILKFTINGFAWSPKRTTPGHSTWLEFSRELLSELPEMSKNSDLIYQIVSNLESQKMLRTFRVQNIQKLPNNEVSVLGTSEWGQLYSFKPEKTHRLDQDSETKYVTLPTELGISFLNFIMCDE